LTPSFEMNPLTQGHEILSLKTRVLGAANSKEFVILACSVLIQITSVSDRRTDRLTDA